MRVRQSPNRGISNQERNRQKRLHDVEAEISDLEARAATISRQLENPPLTREKCFTWTGICTPAEYFGRTARRVDAAKFELIHLRFPVPQIKEVIANRTVAQLGDRGNTL